MNACVISRANSGFMPWCLRLDGPSQAAPYTATGDRKRPAAQGNGAVEEAAKCNCYLASNIKCDRLNSVPTSLLGQCYFKFETSYSGQSLVRVER